MRDDEAGHLQSPGERLAVASTSAIDRVKAATLPISAVVDVLPLETDDARAQAGVLLRHLETLGRDAEKARKAEKEPHLEAGRQVDARFKAACGELDRVCGILRRRLEEAAVKRERELAAARERVQLAAQSKSPEAVNAALADPVFAPVQAVAGISESFTWEPEGYVLSQIPAEFLAVDVAKIRAFVKDCDRKGIEPVIPGVRFKRVAGLRVGSLR